VYKNTIDRRKKIARGKPPDFSLVMKQLFRSEHQLKSDKSSMIVTKKQYLRKDWCKTEPIMQKIREEGCVPKTVVNRFCYGQCNSFYVPRNLSARLGRRRREEPAFRSCGVCKPNKMGWMRVTLHCPGMEPPMRTRKIRKVKNCQCIAENPN